jgi:hypothetical protein
MASGFLPWMHRSCENHGIANGMVMALFNKPLVAGECRSSVSRRQLTRRRGRRNKVHETDKSHCRARDAVAC